MKCIRPTKFPNSNNFYTACGQCMPCRITRRSEWLTRLMLEWKTFKSGAFVTLTYAPDNLPDSQYFKGGSLDKSDMQKFLKRFRKNYQSTYGTTKIRYFAVGEYGEHSSRAHYHLLIFNVDPLFAENVIKKSWTLGHSLVAELNENRIKYTCGYTIKKMTRLEDFPDGRVPEFMLSSKNPAIGWYSIPVLEKLLRKNGLFPSRSLCGEDSWIMKNEGYDMNLWNGVFFFDKSGNIEFPTSEKYKPSKGATYARLDAAMMAKLAHYMTPLMGEFIEARKELLIPKPYKSHIDLLSSKSYLDTIKFVGSEEHSETIKKASKIERQHKNSKSL